MIQVTYASETSRIGGFFTVHAAVCTDADLICNIDQQCQG